MDEHTQFHADGFQPRGEILIRIRDALGPGRSVVVLRPGRSLSRNGTPEGRAETQRHWPRWQELARRLTRKQRRVM
jgi:hypothetical protein